MLERLKTQFNDLRQRHSDIATQLRTLTRAENDLIAALATVDQQISLESGLLEDERKNSATAANVPGPQSTVSEPGGQNQQSPASAST